MDDDGFDDTLAEMAFPEEASEGPNQATDQVLSATESSKKRSSTTPASSALHTGGLCPRRFAGPAGALPKLSLDEREHLEDKCHPVHKKIDRYLSQANKSLSAGEAAAVIKKHQKMKLDFSKRRTVSLLKNGTLDAAIDGLSLSHTEKDELLAYSRIRNIIRRAEHDQSLYQVPFIAGIVKRKVHLGLTCTATNNVPTRPYSIILADSSGQIEVILDKTVVDTHGKGIVRGSSMILQNCTTLIFKGQVLLSAKGRNLVCIATAPGGSAHDDVNGGEAAVPEQSTSNPLSILKRTRLQSGIIVSLLIQVNFEDIIRQFRLCRFSRRKMLKEGETQELISSDKVMLNGESGDLNGEPDSEFDTESDDLFLQIK